MYCKPANELTVRTSIATIRKGIVDYIRRCRHVVAVILAKRRKVSQSINLQAPQHVSSSFYSRNPNHTSAIAEAGYMRTIVPWNT